MKFCCNKNSFFFYFCLSSQNSSQDLAAVNSAANILPLFYFMCVPLGFGLTFTGQDCVIIFSTEMESDCSV